LRLKIGNQELKTGHTAMNRRYPEQPLAGVGAIIFRGSEVLLVKRGHAPGLGKWSVPGGLVELGESLDASIRREVMEEVGLEVKVIDLVAALDRIIFDPNGGIEYHYILLDFLCEVSGGDPIAATDAAECRFIAIEDLCGYAMTRGTEEVIRRAFEKAKSLGIPVYDPPA
jgi:ADP-ribose pyrophosphatase YjhB (NUDIX family)